MLKIVYMQIVVSRNYLNMQKKCEFGYNLPNSQHWSVSSGYYLIEDGIPIFPYRFEAMFPY